MSLAALCSIHSATLYRRTRTLTRSGGKESTSVAVALTGRFQPAQATEQLRYQDYRFNYAGAWYSTTDPQASTGDLFVFAGRKLSVRGTRNFDELGRLWRTELTEGD